ncbi:MAG: PAS domain S-box protein [Bacteroidales bacterium]|nr:PAS domain S-box protein [Bacteroidales bacterium]
MNMKNGDTTTEKKLKERVKELNCLYELSRLMENRNISENEFLQSAVNLIPPAWQYPGITCARLLLNEQEFKTKGFEETPWKLSANIQVHNKPKGRLDVFYLEEKPEMNEGPFLEEERRILDSFVSNLGQYLERKEKEEDLRKNKDILTKTQKLAHIGNWELDLEANHLSWSDEVFRIFGLKPQEYSATYEAFLEYVHPDDRAKVDAAYINSLEEGKDTYELEHRVVRKHNGEVRHVYEKCYHERNREGKVIRSVGIVQDITEQKEIETALRSSRENLRITINSIGDAVIATNTKGHITRMNPVAERLTGWAATEAENQPLEKVFNIFNAKSGKKTENPVKEVLEKGKVVGLANDTKLISKIGNEYLIADSGSPIKNNHGEITGVVLVFRDVTEDYQLRENLKENEYRFRQLFQNMSNSVAVYKAVNNGKDFEIIDFNAAAELAEKINKEEVLGKKVTEVFPGVKDIGLFDVFKRVWETGEAEHHPISKYKDNRISGWRNNYVFKLPTGEIVALYDDVTEQKQAEEKLRESEQKFRDIFNNTGDAIVIQDMQGYFKEVNDIACKRSGYSREELLNKHHFDIESPEFTHRIEERLNIMKQKGEATFETVFRRKDGSKMPVEGIARLTEYEGETAILSVVRDITERIKTEKVKQLLYNVSQLSIKDMSLKEYLRNIHREVSEIMRADNFYIAFYDKNTDKYTLPYHADKYDDLTTDEPMSLKNTLTDYIRKTGEAKLLTEETERELRKKEKIKVVGTPSPVWIGAPIRDSSANEVTGVIALQDYEDKKAYDHDDLHTLSIIATNIGSFIERINHLENLKKAKEKAEESDRLKTAFLANMSHEIRTPMNGILGFTDLLRETDISCEQKDQYTEIIHKSGQRLMNTVNDIVEISKIEAGIISLQKSATNVNKVVKELVNFFCSETQKYGLTLELDQLLPEYASTIFTDQSKLESILTNLIKNGIKYTDSGSIHVGCRMKDQFVEFYVKDTGIGVPENRRDAIFNRFEQADVSDTRAFEGSGLGLAICKSYVEMLGGEIGLESEENKGSTFYFTLPVSKAKSESPEEREKQSQDEPTQKTKAPGKKIKILVAEDDEDSFLYLKTLLKKMDCELIQTITGTETVKQCRNNPDIDLILMDIKLPEMDGYEATRQIRAFNQKVPIIAQTAYAMEGDRAKAINAGCDEYVGKPIKKDDLMEKINKLMK